MYTATLTAWVLENYYGRHRITGTIVGSDVKGRFTTGDVIHTSPVVTVDFERMEARTRNSFYKLV